MLLVPAAKAQEAALASWNDTPTKQAIVAFVEKVTTEGNADFVPVEQRIAVFDMDGTLIPERPVPAALLPMMSALKEAVAKDPSLAEKPAIGALLKGDKHAVAASGEEGINEILAAVTNGRTTEDVLRDIPPLMRSTTHEKFGVPYTKAVYQPMQELLAYLEANGFTNYICSGSPVLFTRSLSQEMFGIPPTHVMGSDVGTRFTEHDGKTVLVFDGRLDRLNDKDNKPGTINLAIGVRPVFVGGNEGGRGDIAMMRWSKDRDGPSFQLLINHNDAEREFAYAESDNYSLDAASRFGFHVVSMKDDWRTIIGN